MSMQQQIMAPTPVQQMSPASGPLQIAEPGPQNVQENNNAPVLQQPDAVNLNPTQMIPNNMEGPISITPNVLPQSAPQNMVHGVAPITPMDMNQPVDQQPVKQESKFFAGII